MTLITSPYLRRLFLPYLLLLSGAVLVVGLLAARRLKETYLDETVQRLSDSSLLVSQLTAVNNDVAHRSELVSQVNSLGKSLACRITVIQPDGLVIAETDSDPARLDNHAGRPEIVAALRTGVGYSIRHSDTVSRPLLYFARFNSTGNPPQIIRLAVSLDELQNQLQWLYGGLALTGIIAVCVVGALSYYFAWRSSMPIVELTSFADAVSRGELSRRIIRDDTGEIRTLRTAMNKMAGSLEQFVADTTRDRAELLAILSSMSEGIVAIDHDQRILLFNEAAAELLDLHEEKIPGRLLWEVTRLEPILRAAIDVSEKGEKQIFQLGPLSGRHLEVTVCPFPQPGKANGVVIVIHDTTESVRYEELRKEFVANVSHELRTPLTAIKGFTETLLDWALNDTEKSRQYVSTIERHTEQLSNLVNDLLELSRLESQTDWSRRMPVDLPVLTRKVIEMLNPLADKKHHTLTLQIDEHLPKIMAIPDYLGRAISNLIENAIKYTPDNGSITVNVARNGEWVLIKVIDTGIGIPADDLRRVFERFYRVDRSRSREMGGTGLGLSIVKHVAQAHRGSVEASSTPGKGSTFTFRIPLN